MRISPMLLVVSLAVAGGAMATSAAAPERFDVLLRGGMVYDGKGTAPVRADVGLRGDRIATVGNLDGATAKLDLSVAGYAVAPGFINMLSWATESLIADGRSLCDIRQGVTTEIFGEGTSMGPLTPEMKTPVEVRAGRHQIRLRVDDAVGLSALPRKTRRDAECRVVHRFRYPARARRRLDEPASRLRPSSIACGSSFGRRCKLARSGSGRR